MVVSATASKLNLVYINEIDFKPSGGGRLLWTGTKTKGLTEITSSNVNFIVDGQVEGSTQRFHGTINGVQQDMLNSQVNGIVTYHN